MASLRSPRPTALVVEDEPLIAMETADLLSDVGFDVLEASHAAAALTALSARPDTALMVTDVQMPGRMNGFALARAVRASYAGIAIIVCSGQVAPEEGEMPQAAVFIYKPLSALAISQAVRDLRLPNFT